MNNSPESHNLEELLAGYVLGDLDEEELTWLNQQLSLNPELKEQVKQLEATLTLMPYGLPEVTPQDNLRSKILATARSQATTKPKLNYLGWMVSTITTLVALGLGVNSYGLRQQLAETNHQLQQQQELVTLLRQPNNRLVSLRGLDRLSTASGSLFIAPEADRAVLVLQNLEPLPGQQVYRLWVESQGQKTGCANFTPDATGTVHLQFSNDALNDAKSIFVTIEPEADTEIPQGNPIMTNFHSL